MAKAQKNTAILLAHCPDKKGVIASITDFLLKNNGHIIDLDQHVDHANQHFFIRVEWELEDFQIPKEKLTEYFGTLIANQYDMEFKIKFSQKIPRAAIFVSKYTHGITDILSRYESKEWNIEIPLIISNHEKLRYIAERYDIPYHCLPITPENKAEQEAKELELLKAANVDLIILARYMQVVSDDFISHYRDRIINIHHSSLPAFAGANPYKAAYERGVKVMGATAHYVTADLDAGPIIEQDIIRISHNDSISQMKRKGKDIEKIVLAKAIWSHINHYVLSYKNKTVVFD